jgi:hypothetical protein
VFPTFVTSKASVVEGSIVEETEVRAVISAFSALEVGRMMKTATEKRMISRIISLPGKRVLHEFQSPTPIKGEVRTPIDP